MPHPLPPDDARLREVVEDLLQTPPASDAELEQRLAGLDPALLRRQLVAHLQQGLPDEAAGSLVIAALGLLGLNEASGQLEQLLADPGFPLRSRAVALTALLADAPGRLGSLVQGLSPAQALPLIARWLTEVLGKLQADPRQAEAVALALEGTPAELRAELLALLERARRQEGTSAAACYASALARPGLTALQQQLLLPVIAEASRQGLELLERLQQEAGAPEPTRRLQHALVRLRTRRLERRRDEAPVGRAFVGSCDGQGAFIVVACVQNPGGRCSLIDICLRPTDVCDATVSPGRCAEDLVRLLDEMTAGTGLSFVQVPLPVAGALVAEAVARSEAQGYRLPEELGPALFWFERLGEAQELLPQPQPAAEASQAALRALLARAEYRRSWFLAYEDLEALEADAGALPARGLRRRLVRMSQHMARWHLWRGEAELAALLAAAGRDAAALFSRSPLAEALRERSPHLTASTTGVQGPSVEEQRRLRQELKAGFFQAVKHPKGRDLARLDFAQVAYFQLLQGCQGLPAARRPRHEELLPAAYALGATFADFLLAGARWPLEQAIGRMTDCLRDSCQLSSEERHALVALLLPALGRFIEHVCASCPVACLDRPLAAVADIFFGTREPGPQHPS